MNYSLDSSRLDGNDQSRSRLKKVAQIFRDFWDQIFYPSKCNRLTYLSAASSTVFRCSFIHNHFISHYDHFVVNSQKGATTLFVFSLNRLVRTGRKKLKKNIFHTSTLVLLIP